MTETKNISADEIKNKRYTIAGKSYMIKDMTLEQMEIISDVLSEARLKIFEAAVGVHMRASTEKIILNIAELLHQLRVDKKLHKLISYILVEVDKEFSCEEATANFDLIKKLPYNTAEEIFGLFFCSGILLKIIMPTFLMPTVPAEQSQSEKE